MDCKFEKSWISRETIRSIPTGGLFTEKWWTSPWGSMPENLLEPAMGRRSQRDRIFRAICECWIGRNCLKSLEGRCWKKPRCRSQRMCHTESSWQEVSITICGVTAIAEGPDKELKFTDWRDISKTLRISPNSLAYWSKCGFAATSLSGLTLSVLYPAHRENHF